MMLCMTITHLGVRPDPDARVVPEWELCDRLARSLRLVGGLTQAEIGHFIGVRQETISRWLTGKNRPNRATLMVWADMTGVDLDWLLYGIRDSNPEPADWEPVRLAPVVSLAPVKTVLTLNRRTAEVATRHLRCVS